MSEKQQSTTTQLRIPNLLITKAKGVMEAAGYKNITEMVIDSLRRRVEYLLQNPVLLNSNLIPGKGTRGKKDESQ